MKIFQIETTNNCNATCSYCPHSEMTREKGNMNMLTFEKTLEKMTNKYVGLHHFGEPFINRNLPIFIRILNFAGIKCEFSTNGIIDDSILIEQVMLAEPHILRIAYDFAKPLSFILKSLNFNKSTIIKLHSVKGLLETKKPFNNFAGAVKGESQVSGECYFKKYGYVCILWNGDIVPCCQDFNGKEIIGSVFDGKEPELKSDYSICKNCSGMQFAEDGLWEEK